MSEKYLVLCSLLLFLLEKGGGGRGFFSGQGNVPFQFYEFSRIYLVTCSVTPYLNQVFRRCFSMENLRAYVDDGSPSPSVQTTVTTRSTTSTGLSTSSSSSTTSSSVPSTRPSSGPVQDVVTHTSSPAVVPTDKTVSLKDLPPPPPPDEPYELFLARVACQTEDASGGSRRPAAVGPVPPPQQPSTVGIRLPTPFPRFEDTAWASLPSVQGPRIRMPLPASCYVPPPQPWTWSGRGPNVPALQVRSPAPLLSSTDPIRFPGPSTLTGGPPATGPPSSTHPSLSSSVLQDAVPTPPCFRGFFQGATPPFIQKAATSSVPTAALQMTPQPGETVPQEPPPAVVQDWKAQIFEDMRLYWRQLQGDAPPQSTWVPLFPRGTWAPTHCGSWVPLATERRHGLSISPVQNEQAAPLADEAVPARGPPVTAPDEGTVALGCLRTPLPAIAGLLLPIAPAQTAQGPRTVVPQKVVRAHSAPPDLGPRAPAVIGAATLLRLRHLHVDSGVARLPLVSPSGPAWLRGLLGDPPLRLPGDLTLIASLVILHETLHLLRLVFVDVIISHLHHLGRLHLKGLGPSVELILIATLDRSARNVAHILMTQTYVSCVCGRTLKRIVTSQVLIPVVLLNQPSLSVRMTLSRRQRYRNCSLTLQHRQLCRTTRTLSRTVRPLPN